MLEAMRDEKGTAFYGYLHGIALIFPNTFGKMISNAL